MTIYTVWSSKDGGEITMVAGEDRPKFAGGSLQPNCVVLLWRIEAATFEEASAIHHLRMGWDPYKPMGKPQACPKCGVAYYPKGSGECWRCGKV
jgi:hypothetical protein